MIKNIILLIFFVSSLANAVTSRQLAADTEKLYLKLEPQSAQRPALALRLADLCFDAAVEVDKNSKFTAQEIKEVEVLRKRALELYEKSLNGFSGAYAKPSAEQKLRIQFQMARIYNDLGQMKISETIWKELSGQVLDKKIQREASLRLAEKLEISTEPKELLEAKRLYDLALKTCESKDLCSYISYRRGWVSHRLGQSSEGLAYLIKALESSDKGSVNEILNDYLLFVSRSDWSFSKAMATTEGYAKRYQRPELSEKLIDAYYAADRREQYNEGLVYLNKKSPRVDRLISQLEFQYTEKNLKEVSSLLVRLKEASRNQVGFTDSTKKSESEKSLYRLIVEWDGQRKATPEFASFVEEGVQVFTSFFPDSPEYQKVVEGWLAVEPSLERKSAQLKIWTENQKKHKNSQAEIKLRKLRLGLAAQQKDFPAAMEESQALMILVPQGPEHRDFLYQSARAAYDLKKYDQALPVFVQLAHLGKDKPDQTAIFSQNLALDILAQQKDYTKLLSQVRSWTENSNLKQMAKQDSKFQKELEEMTVIAEKTQFEQAANEKNADSLKLFTDFCLKGKLQPKSCDNAKQLAVQLKDQDTLIVILKYQGKEEDLAAELEFGGYFKEAAEIYEKQLKASDKGLEEYFRIALLYELANQGPSRDRILNLAVEKAQKSKSLSMQQESLLYLALKDAGLLTVDLLKFPWSEASGKKEQLAAELENQHKGNAQTRKVLMSTCRDLGPVWTEMQLSQLREMNEAQKKIHFYGKNSLAKFQSRVSALKKMSESSQCFIKGTNSASYRAGVHFTMAESYGQFAKAIRETPIPEGVEGDMLAQVKAQVEEMAAPFSEQASAWKKQADASWSQVPSSEAKPEILASGQWNFEMLEAAKTPVPKTSQGFNWTPLIQKLKKNPYEKSVVSEIRQQFEDKGQERLAAYFKGREKSMNAGESL